MSYYTGEAQPDVSAPVDRPRRDGDRIESAAFYVALAAVVLAPLAFLPTPYIALDAVKTVLIAICALVAFALNAVALYRSDSFSLPSRGVSWSATLVAVSLVVSSIFGTHASKSFFGQGFEINTAGFLIVLLLIGLSVFWSVLKKPERAVIVYVGMTASFLILYIGHALRFIAGPSFMSLGILQSVTSTVAGTWYDVAALAIVISTIALAALVFLPLSRRMKTVYAVLLVLSLVAAYIINSRIVWFSALVAFIAIAAYASSLKPRAPGGAIQSFMKRIVWLPVIIAVIAGALSWKGISLAGPVIRSLGAEHTSLVLPWQFSLDVTSGALKQAPFFGVGPNRFSQAYIVHKPFIINSTYAWDAEFNYAFGLLPTFIATQGLVGVLAWSLLAIFIGISIVRMLRKLPEDPHVRFTAATAVTTTVFLWILALLTVPSHTVVLYASIATAITLGIGAVYGSERRQITIKPRVATAAVSLIVVVCTMGVFSYAKDAAALAYFGSGAKALSERGDAVEADRLFGVSYTLNPSDVYLQARAEADIVHANQVASSITQGLPASTTEALVNQTVEAVNSANTYAGKAIGYDPTNYYNYLSAARVSELATSIQMDGAYDNTVAAYTRAIQINPLNPALYLNLARFQANNDHLEEATRTIGAGLQVKNDYLDAIFLLSQISAAQGNLTDAITAAQVASELYPNNAVVFFQLGLLNYNNKSYSSAATALERAIELQPDYANAKYFLGLTYVRLGRSADAIVQFSELAESNPDNEEVLFILSNLQSGRSPFADAQPPVTPDPENRPELPIDEE